MMDHTFYQSQLFELLSAGNNTNSLLLQVVFSALGKNNTMFKGKPAWKQ